MGLLNDGRWSGKIFTGKWRVAGGGEISVTEPATGLEIGSVGCADVADLDRSVARPGKRKSPGPYGRSASEPASCEGQLICGRSISKTSSTG